MRASAALAALLSVAAAAAEQGARLRALDVNTDGPRREAYLVDGYTGLPWGGEPLAVPGVVQMELFDRGGEGMVWGDEWQNNALRPNDFREDEDGWQVKPQLKNVPSATTPVLEAIVGGEYLTYTVNVQYTGTYAFAWHLSLHGPNGPVHFQARITVGSGEEEDACAPWLPASTININADTGGIVKKFQDFAGTNVDLEAGTWLLTVCFEEAGYVEMDYFTVAAPTEPPTEPETDAPTPAPTPAPTAEQTEPHHSWSDEPDTPQPTFAPTPSPTPDMGDANGDAEANTETGSAAAVRAAATAVAAAVLAGAAALL